jgi:hypothetical protein
MASGGLALAGYGRPASNNSSEPQFVSGDLPKGTAPAPVSIEHFPTRLHAFVWRNWPLVPAGRMAKLVHAPKSEILRMGKAMGLGRQPRITDTIRARSYITVIRRNWHILPYEQLLELLDWTPEEMAFALREDDFLYVKLGNLKPACQPLFYEKPTQATLAREVEIRSIMTDELPDLSRPAADPLFGFLDALAKPPTQKGPPPATVADAPLRFCYSYFALYGDPLLDTEADPYPDGYLARLAAAGVNGIWLQAVLFKLARFPWQPGLSEGCDERLVNLRKLVTRAARHGIRVFLYLNEPRSMPLSFYKTHAELQGAVEGDHAALCTSHPEVQKYLQDSIASICRAVPKLGGFFTITASENLTNCWSHGGGAGCPKCGSRSAAEVIPEVNSLIWHGIKDAGTEARLIAWDWGWSDSWAPDAINRLPKEISFMSVSEWRLPINRGGISTEVGEYSISAVGPGPRATRHWELARARGMACVAKIQAGNTWELSTVPYIPAVANVARHAENLSRAGVTEQMLGWTLGGYPSPNLEVVSETGRTGSAAEGMRRVAVRRFGAALAPKVIQAWERISAAFSEFPYHGGVVYSAPQQMGPANLLWDRPTGYRATMVGYPYDDLNSWRAVYPPEVFATQLEKVSAGFGEALLELMAQAESIQAAPRECQALAEECRIIEAVMIHFRSAANQARFVMNRRDTGSSDAVSSALRLRILKEEIQLAKRLHALQTCDSRLGFEATNHYFFVPVDLAEKVLNCRYLLASAPR